MLQGQNNMMSMDLIGTMRNGDIMLNDQGQHGEQLNDCVQDDVMLKDWGQDDKM